MTYECVVVALEVCQNVCVYKHSVLCKKSFQFMAKLPYNGCSKRL